MQARIGQSAFNEVKGGVPILGVDPTGALVPVPVDDATGAFVPLLLQEAILELRAIRIGIELLNDMTPGELRETASQFVGEDV